MYSQVTPSETRASAPIEIITRSEKPVMSNRKVKISTCIQKKAAGAQLRNNRKRIPVVLV